jgi:parvulin-like peptidyl-prolyl isomerase
MKTSRAILCIVACAVAVLASGSTNAAPPATTEESILAVVNEHPITSRDVVTLFNNRHAGHAKFLGGEVEARKFLDVVIDDRLLIEEAYALGLGELPEVTRFVDDYARKQMARYYVSTEIETKVKTSPEEVKEVWSTWLKVFVHAQQVVVTTRSEAEQIRAAIIAGASVDDLARQCSVAPSRTRGGHVMAGWGQYGPEWEKVVFALEPGQVSPVIETGGLFEVVLLGDRVEVPLPDLESVAKKIDDELFRRKLDARKREVAAALCSKYGVEFIGLEYSPALLLRLLDSNPDAPLVTWNGGALSVSDVFTKDDLQTIAVRGPVEARKLIEEQIRMTLNSPLVHLEAQALHLDQATPVAADIERYRDYIVEGLLYRDHIFKDLNVGNDELETYYKENSKEFARPEQRRIAQILTVNEADAQKVRKLVTAAGANFAALVKEHSRDIVSAAASGDLGWISPDKVPAGFEEVFKLPLGGISKPLHSSAGWHIFKVLDIRPEGTPAFTEVVESVKERLLERKKRDARAFWVKKLRAASEIKIDDAAIASFVKANESVAPPPQHGMQ